MLFSCYFCERFCKRYLIRKRVKKCFISFLGLACYISLLWKNIVMSLIFQNTFVLLPFLSWQARVSRLCFYWVSWVSSIQCIYLPTVQHSLCDFFCSSVSWLNLGWPILYQLRCITFLEYVCVLLFIKLVYNNRTGWFYLINAALISA